MARSRLVLAGDNDNSFDRSLLVVSGNRQRTRALYLRWMNEWMKRKIINQAKRRVLIEFRGHICVKKYHSFLLLFFPFRQRSIGYWQLFVICPREDQFSSIGISVWCKWEENLYENESHIEQWWHLQNTHSFARKRTNVDGHENSARTMSTYLERNSSNWILNGYPFFRISHIWRTPE